MPTLAIVFYVHCDIYFPKKVEETRKHCGDYVATHSLAIDSSMVQETMACHSVIVRDQSINDFFRRRSFPNYILANCVIEFVKIVL